MVSSYEGVLRKPEDSQKVFHSWECNNVEINKKKEIMKVLMIIGLMDIIKNKVSSKSLSPLN